MRTIGISLLYINLLSISFFTHALFYEANTANGGAYCILSHAVNMPEEHYFMQLSFKLPHLLRIAKERGKTVIVTIPEEFKRISPIDEGALVNEGARVALTWASVFFRFNDLDVRVLRVPNNQRDIGSYLAQILTLKVQDDSTLSKEEQFERRIYDSAYLRKSDEILKLTPTKVENDFGDIIKINPNFPETKDGQKRIVITGGAGFLGSFMTATLLEEGHQVIVLDNYFCCEKTNLKNYANDRNLKMYKYDVSEPFDIEGRVDWVVHLASVPSPVDYYAKPHETLLSGLHGTYNCLELAVRKNARFFYSSTSEVYGDPEISPQSEEYEGNVNPYGKRCQYDESKRGAETLIKLYFDKYHLDVRIARIFNTYGPHMRLGDGRVITNFIQAMLEDKPLIIHGDGTQTRSFCYVSDTVKGLVLLLKAENTFGTNLYDRVFNVGSSEEYTINELAKKVQELSLKELKKPVEMKKIAHIDKTDPKVRRPDLKKIEEKLGYNPLICLDEGLKNTLEYFRFQR